MTKTEINKNNCKNILRGVLQQAEIKYYENLFDEHKDSVHNMWKSLNPIINPKKGKSATVIKKLIIDRNVILEEQNISDDMNEHFCNVGDKLQAEIPDYGLKYMEYMPPRTANSFYLEPVTSEDIMLEIKRMKPNKSPYRK